MKIIRRLYHFLGGVVFAVILITLVASFVIAGTFIESWADSHRYAALFTYKHPVFISMLWLFFVNILIAALRRWPFRKRHFPFLITHLGLLMILAGAIVKSSYGTQGSMGILEGSGKGEIFLEDTYVVHVEDYQKRNSQSFPIKKDIWGRFNPNLGDSLSSFPNLNILLAEYLPNAVEKFEYWIKDDSLCIDGLPPFQVFDVTTKIEGRAFPVSYQGSLLGLSGSDWNIMALRGGDVETLLKEAFIQDTELRISRSDNEDLLVKIPLMDALRRPVEFGAGDCSFQLEMSYSLFNGLEEANLKASMSGEDILIALSEEGSLINRWVSRPHLGTPPFVMDLERKPTLLFIEDEQGENYLFSFSRHGEIEAQDFRADRPKTLIVYDGGHGGYGFQTELSISNGPVGRRDRQAATLYTFSRQFREVAEASSTLAQPLEVFRQACEKEGEDFVEMLTSLVHEWDKRRSWLYPKRVGLSKDLKRVFDSFDWNKMSKEDIRSSYWISRLFEEISPALEKKEDLAEILRIRQWPLLEHLQEQRKRTGPVYLEEYPEFLVLLSQQIVDMSQYLPAPEELVELSPEMKARYFTAFLRSMGFQFMGNQSEIHKDLREYNIAKLFKMGVDQALGANSSLSNKRRADTIATLEEESSSFQSIKNAYSTILLLKGEEAEDLSPNKIAVEYLRKAPIEVISLGKKEQKLLEASFLPTPNTLECSITKRYIEMPFKNKIEDNIPKISLLVSEGAKKQLITLAYDPYGNGLKWPTLNGEYLFRFQPRFLEIPYHVRLRDTRQLNYASSMQAFSYESDIIITDKRNGESVEATLSMNNVYETWDGYRFYMANISPPNEVAAQRAQIIVNHDPGKYWLTYPGGCILTVGMVLLFWLRPYRKKNFVAK